MNGVKFKRDTATIYNQIYANNQTTENAIIISKDIMLHNIVQTFFNNHVMEFNIARMLNERTDIGTPRRRRHQFSMVLMGIVIFLMFFVTLGFQFLATFSGKAFLMAKMALLLASINGLKRVASSGVHYGLYHTPDPNFYHYDRFDRPRELVEKAA
ncbi:hypothetical protein PVAND_003024 [Polypedilum vanderplanki]|uniref:Uncharacterized protein n=1 Tax=Polypedilum vanderplanki TaxID=319348 RepID=A0A9J6BSS3_POLVA|nr:hypothetical protein PVAND_003024 [Polypedilum vanderplanki]